MHPAFPLLLRLAGASPLVGFLGGQTWAGLKASHLDSWWAVTGCCWGRWLRTKGDGQVHHQALNSPVLLILFVSALITTCALTFNNFQA